jgi:hypothetical protein
MSYRLINSLIEEYFYRPMNFSVTVPEGYELVETEEHKRERLESELQQKKKMLSYHEKALASLSAQIEQEEKELLSLTQ